MASNWFRFDGCVMVKSEALVRLASERVDPRLQTAAAWVIRGWRAFERQYGFSDDAMCAYLTLRYQRGLQVGEIAQRLGVSRHVLAKSVGDAARTRMYAALQQIDPAYAERWYRRNGGAPRRRRLELVSVA